MGRDLKFRAWDRKSKTMFPVGIDGGKPFPFYKEGESTNCPLCAPNWEDLDREWSDPMQYTGLKDKNGKEIYEGDIVSISAREAEEEFGVIEFNRGRFIWADKQHVGWTLFDQDQANEIVGNIYENPELLKPT